MLISILNGFDSYIKGGSSSSFKRTFDCYHDNLTQFNKDFHQTLIDEPDVRPLIETLLRNLNISKKRAQKYIKLQLSIYELLQLLVKKGSIQADYFLKLIDRKKNQHRINSILTWSLIPANILVFLLLNYPEALSAVAHFALSSLGGPILSGICALGMSLYEIYQVATDRTKTRGSKIRHISFCAVKMVLALTAYSLLIALNFTSTSVVLGLSIGLLFVFQPLLDAINNVWNLIQNKVQRKRYVGEVDLPLDMQRQELREKVEYKKQRDAAWINCSSALLIAGMTAVACFIPGAWITALVAVGCGLVYFAHTLLLKYNERTKREQLQFGLRCIHERHYELVELQEMPRNPYDMNAFFKNETNQCSDLVVEKVEVLHTLKKGPFFDEQKPVFQEKPNSAASLQRSTSDVLVP